jgi:hypothetical protein
VNCLSKSRMENSPMIFCCRIPLSRLDVQPAIWRDQNSRIADNDASARSGTQSLRNCRVAMPSLERPLLRRRKQAPVLSADTHWSATPGGTITWPSRKTILPLTEEAAHLRDSGGVARTDRRLQDGEAVVSRCRPRMAYGHVGLGRLGANLDRGLSDRRLSRRS